LCRRPSTKGGAQGWGKNFLGALGTNHTRRKLLPLFCDGSDNLAHPWEYQSCKKFDDSFGVVVSGMFKRPKQNLYSPIRSRLTTREGVWVTFGSESEKGPTGQGRRRKGGASGKRENRQQKHYFVVGLLLTVGRIATHTPSYLFVCSRARPTDCI